MLFRSVGTLGFPLLARQFPTSYAGRATTSLNMFAFIGAFITQFGVGPVLDLWPSVAGRYAPDAYGVALLAIALAQALALANLYLSARIRRNRSGE